MHFQTKASPQREWTHRPESHPCLPSAASPRSPKKVGLLRNSLKPLLEHGNVCGQKCTIDNLCALGHSNIDSNRTELSRQCIGGEVWIANDNNSKTGWSAQLNGRHTHGAHCVINRIHSQHMTELAIATEKAFHLKKIFWSKCSKALTILPYLHKPQACHLRPLSCSSQSTSRKQKLLSFKSLVATS